MCSVVLINVIMPIPTHVHTHTCMYTHMSTPTHIVPTHMHTNTRAHQHVHTHVLTLVSMDSCSFNLFVSPSFVGSDISSGNIEHW